MNKAGAAFLSAMLMGSMLPSVAMANNLQEDADSVAEVMVASDSQLESELDSDSDSDSDSEGALPDVHNKVFFGSATWDYSDGALTIHGAIKGLPSKVNKAYIDETFVKYANATKVLIAGEEEGSGASLNTFTSRTRYDQNTRITSPLFPNVEEVVFSSDCSSIGSLFRLLNLKKLTIPEDCVITSIVDGSFSWSRSDDDPNVWIGPDWGDTIDLSKTQITELPPSSFMMNPVSKVILPNTLKTIRTDALREMHNLKTIVIPSSVTRMESDVFWQSPNIELVELDGDTLETIEGQLALWNENSEDHSVLVKVHGTKELTDSVKTALNTSFVNGAHVDTGVKPNVKLEQRFDANYDGADAIETQWVSMGEGLDAVDAETSNAPALTRAGYTLTGWYSDAECTTPYDFTAPMEHGAVAYAGWKQIINVDVVYGNGSENATIATDENDLISRPATDPVRAGYKFAGWFSDEACETEFDFAKPVVEGARLYAGWSPVKASVVNVDGTKTDLQVKSDGTIAEPTAPTRENYVFKGWYSDADCTQAFDFSQPLYDDVTLYSKWEAKAAEPTNPDDGSDDNAQKPAVQPNGSQNGNGTQQGANANNSTAQTLAQTGDAATAAVPVVAFVSAMAAAAAAFARKRIARR